MNILVLADGFWPDELGGICKSLLYEIEEFHRSGHQIIILTKRLRKNLPCHESKEEYKLFRYFSPARGTAFYHLYPFFTRWQVPRLVSKLHQKFHFDVASIHNPIQAISFPPIKNLPIIYTFHSPMYQEIEIERQTGKYGVMNLLAKAVVPYIKKIEKKSLRISSKIVVRSQFMIHEIEKITQEIEKEKIRCIPLGVDNNLYAFSDNPQSLRLKLNLPVNKPVFLTVRRLASRMGLEALITAMSSIVREFSEVLLLIGGTGHLEKELKNQVEFLGLTAHVRFLGFVPEEILPLYYQAADLFVMPSAYLEGFGLSTIESLSCGTPVIATRVGANPEILDPLNQSFLCKGTKPEDLAERIIWFLKNNFRKPRIREDCRIYCEKNFSVRNVADSLEKVFQEAVDSYSSRWESDG